MPADSTAATERTTHHCALAAHTMAQGSTAYSQRIAGITEGVHAWPWSCTHTNHRQRRRSRSLSALLGQATSVHRRCVVSAACAPCCSTRTVMDQDVRATGKQKSNEARDNAAAQPRAKTRRNDIAGAVEEAVRRGGVRGLAVCTSRVHTHVCAMHARTHPRAHVRRLQSVAAAAEAAAADKHVAEESHVRCALAPC